MLELNFHDETEKAKPLKRRGTEDAEEQGAEAKGGRRRSKFEGGEANAAAKCASCVSRQKERARPAAHNETHPRLREASVRSDSSREIILVINPAA
jgi:hypothetical protein